MTLEEFGYDEWFARQIDPETEGDLTVARVTAIHKGECEVSDGEEANAAKMTGRLRHRAQSKRDYATVGDWVLVKNFDDEDFGRIVRILDRRSELKRKSAGRTTRYQLIASNIDVAFIMQTLGPGYNLKRLERYLVMVNESGIDPVVLLSKTDLLKPEELAVILAEIKERMPETRVPAFSNVDQNGLQEVEALFEPGKTFCVIGTSGVGKTSLLNNLLDEEDELFTLPVRESDGKGVHSTTWRELITLYNGAHVVDTPGMRKLGNLDVNEGIGETFDDVLALAGECKFNDCAHVNTKGCADGVDAVVTNINIDYKFPLRPRDEFVVKVGMRKQGRLRFVFDQAIFRKSDEKLIIQAQVTVVLTRSGRPVPPVLFDEVFAANGWTFC